MEEVTYSFNKVAISQTSKEKVKKNAGDFEMFRVPQVPQARLKMSPACGERM